VDQPNPSSLGFAGEISNLDYLRICVFPYRVAHDLLIMFAFSNTIVSGSFCDKEISEKGTGE
jgi:hypothetical protein